MKYKPQTKDYDLYTFFLNVKTLRVEVDEEIQRVYKWGREQLEPFWENMSYSDNYYDLGLLQLRYKEKFEIEQEGVVLYCTDGQQRLTTSVVMVCALINFLKVRVVSDDKRWIGYMNKLDDYIFNYDENDKKIPKLTPSPDVLEHYKVFMGGEPEKVNSIVKRSKAKFDKLAYAYKFFTNKFIEAFDSHSGDDLSKGKKLVDMLETLFRKGVISVRYSKSDHPDDETFVNQSKSLPMLPSDLIKPKLRGLVKNDPEGLKKVSLLNDGLKKLAKLHKKNSRLVNSIDDFFMTHYSSHYQISMRGAVTPSNINGKLFRGEHPVFIEGDKKGILAALDLMIEDLSCYLSIVEGDIDKEIYEKIMELEIGAGCVVYRGFYTRLVNQGDDKKYIIDVLNLLIKFGFLYSKVFRNEDGRAVLFELLERSRSGEMDVDGLRAFFIDVLNTSTTADGDYITALRKQEVLEFKKPTHNKYLQIKINNHLKGHERPTFSIVDELAQVQEEHIIPKGWETNPVWRERLVINGKTQAEINRMVKRLGNTTILTQRSNQKLSNKYFDEKKVVYEKTDWELTKKICSYTAFNIDEIKEREHEIKEHLITLFKL